MACTAISCQAGQPHCLLYPSPPKKLLVKCHPNSKSSAYEPWSHCGKVWQCKPFPAGPIPIQKAIHTPPLYKQVAALSCYFQIHFCFGRLGCEGGSGCYAHTHPTYPCRPPSPVLIPTEEPMRSLVWKSSLVFIRVCYPLLNAKISKRQMGQ